MTVFRRISTSPLYQHHKNRPIDNASNHHRDTGQKIAFIIPLVRPDPEYGLPTLASRLEWIPDRFRRYWHLFVPGHAPLSRLGQAHIL